MRPACLLLVLALGGFPALALTVVPPSRGFYSVSCPDVSDNVAARADATALDLAAAANPLLHLLLAPAAAGALLPGGAPRPDRAPPAPFTTRPPPPTA